MCVWTLEYGKMLLVNFSNQNFGLDGSCKIIQRPSIFSGQNPSRIRIRILWEILYTKLKTTKPRYAVKLLSSSNSVYFGFCASWIWKSLFFYPPFQTVVCVKWQMVVLCARYKKFFVMENLCKQFIVLYWQSFLILTLLLWLLILLALFCCCHLNRNWLPKWSLAIFLGTLWRCIWFWFKLRPLE